MLPVLQPAALPGRSPRVPAAFLLHLLELPEGQPRVARLLPLHLAGLGRLLDRGLGLRGDPLRGGGLRPDAPGGLLLVGLLDELLRLLGLQLGAELRLAPEVVGEGVDVPAGAAGVDGAAGGGVAVPAELLQEVPEHLLLVAAVPLGVDRPVAEVEDGLVEARERVVVLVVVGEVVEGGLDRVVGVAGDAGDGEIGEVRVPGPAVGLSAVLRGVILEVYAGPAVALRAPARLSH